MTQTLVDPELPHDESVHISQQIIHLELDNKKMITSLAESAKSDLEKGKAVKLQLHLWERLLDLRIRLQKPLELANTLPLTKIFNKISHFNTDTITQTSNHVRDLLQSLIDIRIVIL
jgi:hypothetical protein